MASESKQQSGKPEQKTPRSVRMETEAGELVQKRLFAVIGRRSEGRLHILNRKEDNYSTQQATNAVKSTIGRMGSMPGFATRTWKSGKIEFDVLMYCPDVPSDTLHEMSAHDDVVFPSYPPTRGRGTRRVRDNRFGEDFSTTSECTGDDCRYAVVEATTGAQFDHKICQLERQLASLVLMQQEKVSAGTLSVLDVVGCAGLAVHNRYDAVQRITDVWKYKADMTTPKCLHNASGGPAQYYPAVEAFPRINALFRANRLFVVECQGDRFSDLSESISWQLKELKKTIAGQQQRQFDTMQLQQQRQFDTMQLQQQRQFDTMQLQHLDTMQLQRQFDTMARWMMAFIVGLFAIATAVFYKYSMSE